MQEEYKQYFQYLPPNVAEWFHEDEFKEPYCKNGSERAYYKTMF